MIYPNNKLTKILSLLVMIAGMLQFTSAQNLTVDDIINKNIKARGGAAAWKKVNSIKTSGIYESFSKQENFVMYRMRPDLYKFETIILNKPAVHAFDGKDAWFVDPIMDDKFAKPCVIPTDGNLAKVTLRERYFEPVFWDYKTKGNKVELLGKADVDGEEAYKIKVTLQNGEEENWFISTKTFLEIHMTGTTYDFGDPNRLKMFFSDYRKVGSILIPYLTELEYGIRNCVYEIKTAEINKGVDKKVFVMPVE